MTDANVIETLGKYRLVIRDEQGPDEPYDDGQSPLLRMSARGYGVTGPTVEHVGVGSRPTDDDRRIQYAAERYGTPSGKDFGTFEKWLRAYYGVTEIETYQSGDYWFVTYNPAKWREYVGSPDAKPDLSQWKAYCEGEVYYWTIEYQETWTAETGSDTRQTWETKDAVGTYYGYKWAEERAREEWQSFLAHLDPRICATCAQDLEKTKDSVREDEWPRFLAMIEPEVLALYGDTPEEQRAGIGELWTHVSGVETDDDHDAVPAGEQESTVAPDAG